MAKPYNSVLALGATLLLPPLQIASGIILAFLAIARGVRSAVVLALLAGGCVVLIGMLVGTDLASSLLVLASGWLPVLLLVTLWQLTRSALLTVQLSVILAVSALLVFQWAIGDAVAYWQPMLDTMEQLYQEQGIASPFSAAMDESGEIRDFAASAMTASFVIAFWMGAVLELMLGGVLYKQLPGERQRFTRFRDVDFGRVLATLFAVTLLAAYLTGSAVLFQVGMLLFVAFLLQGFVVLHWLHLEGHSPIWVVLLAYAALIVVPEYVLTAFAVTGFLDAWLRIRRRLVINEGLEK